VEALRYLSLAQVRLEADRIRSHQQNGARVLIVGDMEPGALRELLGTVRDAVALLPPGYSFAFKPHPAYAIDPQQSGGLDVPVVRGGLVELLDDFDFVIAGNSTSACVDAFLAGKPVIIGHSGQYLNLSPLRGQSGVAFFESPQQLVAVLLAGDRGHGIAHGQNDYFYLNENLTRWKKLLGLSHVDGKVDEKNEDGSDGVVSEQSF
jgi:surface carbohydrate biosynthesis protein (TIGR04326 family)